MANGLDAALVLVSFAFFVEGVRRQLKKISIGLPSGQESSGRLSFREFLREVFGHAKVLREPQGVHHYLFFLGFLIPLAFVALVQLSFAVPAPAARFVSLLLEITGVLGLYGLSRLFFRRYLNRPTELKSGPEDFALLAFFGLLFKSGFFVEAGRLALAPSESALWSPVGYLLSLPLGFLSQDAKLEFLRILWRLHLFTALAGIALLPYGKTGHAVYGAMNLLWYGKRPKAFPTPDLENSEYFGAGHISKLTRKNLLNISSCVRCGRCEKVCPANFTGKPLSPQKVVGDLNARLSGEAAGIMRGGEENIGSPLVGEGAILEETLWSCTACLHCVEACPLAVNPLYKIIEMRRFEVLMEGRMPPELITFNRNLEKNFNPWGIGWSKREEWIERRGLPVPIAKKGEQYDVLLFLGCAGAFDDRYQRTVASLVRILALAGVKFAVLGNAEKCCGEPARVTGNEYLFQTLARENIENIKALGVKTVVTACPHCQKTLSADYADLGGDIRVLHHSSYLTGLLESGKLSLKTPLEGTATLHDSCYLSRYFCNIEKPRRIVSASGLTLREMEKRGEKTFCCGGGGGRMWMEDKGTRIGDVRAKEALATGSSIIATSCPFCLSMLTDGVKAAGREDSAEVLDLAEILERALT